jgi:serine/threonine protein kinase
MLCELYGERDQVKVLNTGLGELFNYPGYPRHAAPERHLSTDEYDGRADIYSLGLLIAECLTGEPAPAEPDPDEVIRTGGKSSELHFDPSLILSPLYPVLKKACAALADDRYQSPREMRLVIETVEAAIDPSS